ncbi:trypsin-like [Coccinella septempunctata]|uniref:trypsin-like n=1 Tax=Coccinella septempunctata TaxID=41139 RepID=UPI001D069B97|nr:trypsin-like [Coccinella septempunctata]
MTLKIELIVLCFLHSALVPRRFYVNGTQTAENSSFKCKATDYPFLVLLHSQVPKLYCGGALIEYDTVVTASSCVEKFVNSPEKLEVLFNVSPDFPNGTDRSRADKIFPHPIMDKRLSFHNISVVILERPIIKAKPIRLPRMDPGKTSGICEIALTMAYTYATNMGGFNLDPQLHCLNLPNITEDKCWQIDGKNADAFLCRFPETVQFDKSCRDYLGYPVFCGDTLYGIVSRARNCSFPDVGNYQISVDFVIDFLHQKTAPKRMEKFIEKRKSSCGGKGGGLLIVAVIFSICTFI